MIVCIANRYEYFRNWCKEHGVNPGNKHLLWVNGTGPDSIRLHGISDPLVIYINHAITSQYFNDVLQSRARSGPVNTLTSEQVVFFLEYLERGNRMPTYEQVVAFKETWEKGDVPHGTPYTVDKIHRNPKGNKSSRTDDRGSLE